MFVECRKEKLKSGAYYRQFKKDEDEAQKLQGSIIKFLSLQTSDVASARPSTSSDDITNIVEETETSIQPGFCDIPKCDDSDDSEGSLISSCLSKLEHTRTVESFETVSTDNGNNKFGRHRNMV